LVVRRWSVKKANFRLLKKSAEQAARLRRAYRIVDAAMALHGCGVDITFVTPTVQEIPWRLLDAFKAACRAAEEVERG
jgi:hypothetical protein